MCKVLIGLLFGLTTLFSSQAATISLADGSDLLPWDFSIRTLQLKLDNNSAGFAKTTFELGWMTADDTTRVAVVDTFDFAFADYEGFGIVYSSGAIIGGEMSFSEPVAGEFPTFAYFVANGQPLEGNYGSNNYIGIRLQNGDDFHYGWLRFDFQPFSEGDAALTFLEGYINDIPGANVEAGAIPEPSTLALLGGSIALLPIYRRFRRQR